MLKLSLLGLLAVASTNAAPIIVFDFRIDPGKSYDFSMDTSSYGTDPALWPTSVSWTAQTWVNGGTYHNLLNTTLWFVNQPLLDLGSAYLVPGPPTPAELALVPDNHVIALASSGVTILTPAQQAQLFSLQFFSARVTNLSDWPPVDLEKAGSLPFQLTFTGGSGPLQHMPEIATWRAAVAGLLILGTCKIGWRRKTSV